MLPCRVILGFVQVREAARGDAAGRVVLSLEDVGFFDVFF
jgi:hypothetical protein